MKWFVGLAVLLVLSACGNQSPVVSEPEHDKGTDLPTKMLMHDVYLNLKDSIKEEDLAKCLEELKRLGKVESTHWLHVGKRAETGDARLDKNYDLALHVVFLSQEHLERYSVDPLHLNVRENIKGFLAGPPVVYDYWVD